MTDDKPELKNTVKVLGHSAEDVIIFIVPSESGGRPYKVSFNPKNIKFIEENVWVCECKNFMFQSQGHLRYACKHIFAVREFLQEVCSV
jgi:predicted nucleic acid-binding Zn finger protein